MTCLLVLLLISTKYYHISSNCMGVTACTRVRIQGRQLHNVESESCLSCTWHAYWSSSSSLPNIIKLSQTVWELWPAQDFGYRGDYYITKTVRVVTLACNIPTGPLLSNIFKICLRVSKLWPAQDFHFRGDNFTTNKVRVLSVTHNTLTGPPLHPYQILSNYLKQYGSYGPHKILASGEITI